MWANPVFRYVKNKAEFDRSIAAWQKKKGIDPNGPPGQIYKSSQPQTKSTSDRDAGQTNGLPRSQKRVREDDKDTQEEGRYQKGRPINKRSENSKALTSKSGKFHLRAADCAC
jgi:hypothetical protein